MNVESIVEWLRVVGVSADVLSIGLGCLSDIAEVSDER